MTQLKHARITPIDARDTEMTAKAFDVQFNPASLRLQTSAQPAGGGQQSSVRRQAATNAKTTLSMDLHFDTYDEGSTDDPVPVTGKTAQLEQFLRPVRPAQGGNTVPPPPRIKFTWAGFEITGIVNQLGVEYDHFHHLGAPLRAKCNLTLESQDPLLAAPSASSGPATPNVATPAMPTGPAALPGTRSASPATKGALAQAGESLTAFAQRNGLDPRDWRALALGIPDVTALPAGLEITFGTPGGGTAAATRALGRSAGAEVTAAGGPLTSVSAAKAAAESARTDNARTAFGTPPPQTAASAPTGSTAAATPASPATPVASGPAARRPHGGTMPPPAPVSRPYGAGIPLRPRLGTAQPETPRAQWSPGGHRNRGSCGCGRP